MQKYLSYISAKKINKKCYCFKATNSASARRREGNEFDARQKPCQSDKMLYLLLLCQMCDINCMDRGIP